ncbi:23S rRNA (pseudouridine(1915)-N(3))-methyltransferase RlmH [Pacificimonas sp. WHA3]|uniref:Ribosomal RNA large subunit methyltransferase H n=1 Tax=Pacificimonas pallii TaxID=2827236 RepID=A0ABS6SEM4_9SPHN|nr:23S rRNA (pseudouridine(1915)-N(3))-methyltransferase RlmH [Pacificimonas pallii]MBV7256391.1 23S rRNA (pseudouridine(1915)-N(3))-methyltransferase RlmH [Pacificimonas pallii]
MRLHIIARGKIGRGAEAELVNRYSARTRPKLLLTELPERGGKLAEAPSPSVTIALDERGESLTSRQLADRIGSWRDGGVREARFFIGAADGHDDALRASADLVLAFGRATWPHLLLRAMLAEQLYRAESILAGHPYHREG